MIYGLATTLIRTHPHLDIFLELHGLCGQATKLQVREPAQNHHEATSWGRASVDGLYAAGVLLQAKGISLVGTLLARQ